MHPVFTKDAKKATPIWFATKSDLKAVLSRLDPQARGFAGASGFDGRPGQHLLLPGKDGAVTGVLFGQDGARDSQRDLFRAGRLADLLPAGSYRFANTGEEARLAAL